MADTRKKDRKWWAGFVNGHIDVIEVDTGWGGYGRGPIHMVRMPAIFAKRQWARERYEDVRKIEIKELAK